MSDHDEAYERGLRLGTRLGGPSFQQTVDGIKAIDPALAGYLVADAYGKVLSRDGLSQQNRELCIIAALACRGFLPQLKWHIAAALNVDVTPESIREVLVQALPFAGWPITLNALGTMAEVFTERGVAAPARPGEELSRAALAERGRDNGGRVYANYAAVEERVRGFDGDLARYLTENAYGQVFARPGLSLQQRELVAVAMLTAQQQLTQLAWHLEGALRVGCTAAETKEVIVTMLLYLGWPSTLNALEVWKKATAPRSP
ncbi:MAG TPA: carboxymuconolactone decarboxylase family protein [Polyangia bacterium]|nr:carboxymuconolactone decarboxylase family protein [Polyangia bacterium]